MRGTTSQDRELHIFRTIRIRAAPMNGVRGLQVFCAVSEKPFSAIAAA